LKFKCTKYKDITKWRTAAVYGRNIECAKAVKRWILSAAYVSVANELIVGFVAEKLALEKVSLLTSSVLPS
jgi:hypothetical protein